ncbi:MAG: NADH-quinone oxidoreductase subunit J [Alphaproteobacteria bacterium]|nr:NADH-quinone oxidoreductase subunit J [Alphaproteobacteria bacterium]
MTEIIFYIFSTFLVGASLAVIFSRNPVHSVLFLIFAFFNAAGLFILMGAEFLAMLLVIVYVGAVAVLFLFVVMMMNVTPEEQRSVFSKTRFVAALKTLSAFVIYGVIFLTVALVMLSIAPVVDVIQEGIKFKPDALLSVLKTSKWSLFSPNPLIAPVFLSVIVTGFIARYAAQTATNKAFLTIVSGFVDSLAFMLLLGAAFMTVFVTTALGWIPSPLREDLIASPKPPTDLVSNTHALGQIIYGDYIFAFQSCGIILLVGMIGAIVLTHRRREGSKKQDIIDQVSRCPKETLILQNMPLGKGIE